MNSFKNIRRISLIMCASAFRPFFTLAFLYSALIILMKTIMVVDYLPYFLVENINVLWTYEMIFGVGVAVIAGFLLTVIPTWSNADKPSVHQLVWLILIWSLARASIWLSSVLGLVPVIMTNVLFSFIVFYTLITPLIARKNRRLRLFAYQFFVLMMVQIFGYLAWYQQDLIVWVRWINVSSGVFSIVIISILGRMSTVVVSNALERYEVKHARFVARPPRRNFSILVISIYLFSYMIFPNSSISGWLALASAASILNILNDFHLEKIWRDSYVQPLYLVYLLIAAEFTWNGIVDVWGEGEQKAFHYHHIMAWIGLSLFTLVMIAGQRLTGRPFSYSKEVKAMMMLMMLGSVLSWTFTFIGGGPMWNNLNEWILSVFFGGGVCFCLIYFGPKFWSVRLDGHPE